MEAKISLFNKSHNHNWNWSVADSGSILFNILIPEMPVEVSGCEGSGISLAPWILSLRYESYILCLAFFVV